MGALKEMVLTDEEKITKAAADTPPASLAAMVSRNMTVTLLNNTFMILRMTAAYLVIFSIMFLQTTKKNYGSIQSVDYNLMTIDRIILKDIILLMKNKIQYPMKCLI